MTILLLLATQMLPSTPLPPQMEDAVTRYSDCVQGRWRAAIELRFPGDIAPAPGDGSAVMEQALAACASERSRSMELADTSLSAAREYRDPAYRRSFIRERFDSLDSLMRWSVTPQGDPDNWSPDADD